MEIAASKNLKIIWDWMRLGQEAESADCIVGFGCINDDIAIRCAQLYKDGYAPVVLFSGGLGRNTKSRWSSSEAERYRDIAVELGVPENVILIENRSSNTGENITFSREILKAHGLADKKLLCVHKPFMERRVWAAMKAYWPEADFTMTSPLLDMEEYIERTMAQDMTEKAVIDVIVGDVQRMEIYAEKGFQIPQPLPDYVRSAFENMVALGYTGELI
ncbi:MAG: YdcF family protein [Oscillospiraceae bacterium]|nr:YdcF family protein [Oscillospiraceae bacterium]